MNQKRHKAEHLPVITYPPVWAWHDDFLFLIISSVKSGAWALDLSNVSIWERRTHYYKVFEKGR